MQFSNIKVHSFTKYFFIAAALLFCNSQIMQAAGAKDKFVVVIDAGHGGKDFGAHDNSAREKDINLSVALKVGELCKKYLKNTEVVYTRDDDTFVSLQGRADIANAAKGDLFVSIHTNSVDAKNKNRKNVAGASVYTQGPHKDEANLGVARRENSVIEFENDYEQKYSGFDPSKDESYIIFEMAQKKNLAESNYFAKSVQENLVNIAGRKDRGVHQAGFWVLWSTSMPAVLVELDFICNPESAKYMTSKKGVDELGDAIFQSVKLAEKKWLQRQQAIKEGAYSKLKSGKPVQPANVSEEGAANNSDKYLPTTVKDKKNKSTKKNKKGKKSSKPQVEKKVESEVEKEVEMIEGVFAVAYTPENEDKDLSHTNLAATKNMKRPRTTTDGRRRRSAKARILSNERNIAVNYIAVKSEFAGFDSTSPVVENIATPIIAEITPEVEEPIVETPVARDTKAKSKDKREWISKVNSQARKIKDSNERRKNDKSSKAGKEVAKVSETDAEHAGKRKSLKSKRN